MTNEAKLEGAALVRTITARLANNPKWKDRKPASSKLLASLSGRIPESVLAWLEFDSTSPNGEVSLVKGHRLAVRGAMDLFEELVVSESEGEEWEADTREAMAELAKSLPGEVLLLREPCQQDHFLYLGTKDERGECCVLCLEDEQLWVAWPSFDVYVAEMFDDVGRRDTQELENACAKMQKLVLG